MGGDAASKVMDAYNYIVQRPRAYGTAVTLDIQSGCQFIPCKL